MSAFHFRFAVLLDQRRREEQHCQRELAHHLRTRMILQNQLSTMQQTITDAKAQMAQGLVGRVDLDAVSSIGAYHGQTTIRGRQITQRVAELDQSIAKARQDLLEATKSRKALELLEQQHRQAWQRQQLRREAAQLDELAGQRHARQSFEQARQQSAYATA